MKIIKESFANCSECKALELPSCILETNVRDMKDVDVVFVSENPSTKECEKGIPLTDNIFRKYFKQYIKDECNWLVTNVVLCDAEITDEIVNRCKVNCFEIIKQCDPKVIVIMGTNALKAFDIAHSGITDLRGKVVKWNGYDLLITVPPSFVRKNKKEYDEIFANDIRLVDKMINGETISEAPKQKFDVANNGTGAFYYKIPAKFYTEDYRLVDVQFLQKTQEVLYIFRDKDNKKVYHKENDDYICYQSGLNTDSRHLVSYESLKQVKIPYRAKYDLEREITYEGDLRIIDKHSQDFYIQKKVEEPLGKSNIMFLDIEVYSPTKAFPKPDLALHPISMITYALDTNDTVKTLLVDNKVLTKNPNAPDLVLNENMIMFSSELDMLKAFFKDVEDLDPDIITGWNAVDFDMQYIFNRATKAGLPPERLSPFGEVALKPEYNECVIAGRIVVDQCYLYRSFTFTKEENYKLDTICKKVLKAAKLEVGDHVVEYEQRPNRYIEYNIRDVTLLVDLEGEVKHIQLQNELRKVCKTTSKGVMSTMGQLDPLIVSFLKEFKGLASINSDMSKKETKFPGAYVHEPMKGVHDYCVDFDFTSLYPSLIITYNIGINTFAMKFKDSTLGYDYIYNRDNLPDTFEIIIDPVFAKTEVTVTREQFIAKVEEQNLIPTIWGCFFKHHDDELSVYAEILDMLMSKRKEYKKLMLEAKESGDKEKTVLYNTRQLVYKVLANSLYGVLGNQFFRFFNLDCASSVTMGGQEAIKQCIVQGDSYVKGLKTGKYEPFRQLTKQEIYIDNLHLTGIHTPYVVTGDTDSLFVTYKDLVDKKKSDDEIMLDINKWNSDLQTFLNKDIIEPMVALHNVPIKYNRLDLKNELIIKRGLFLAKKRYVIYVVEQEGKKIDEVNGMGLETKRSDFGSYTKECLHELIDLILKSEKVSIKKLTTYVKSKENEFLEFIKNGDKAISRPCSFAKKMEEYKVIPQGVKSMISWNDLEYDAFFTGTKGYLYKIKGIDLDKAPLEVAKKFDIEFLRKGKKLEVIALPAEESRLPEYYIPDMKAMLKFAWTDRYELLLDPIMQVQKTTMTW